MKKSFRDIKYIPKLLCFLLICLNFNAHTQNKLSFGHLLNKNYPRSVYNGQQQNFGIVETEEQTLMFANKSAILEFNGNSWTKVRIPENQNIGPRTLYKTTEGVILAGGENVFGKIDYEENGGKVFTDLSAGIDKELIGKVWTITGSNGVYYFVGLKGIFIYREGEEIEVIQIPEGYNVDFSNAVGNDIFITAVKKKAGNNEKVNKYFYFKSDSKKFEPFLTNIDERQSISNINYIFPWKDNKTYLAFTQKGNAYTINKASNELYPLNAFNFNQDDVLINIREQNGLIFFSTEKSGVFIFNRMGALIRQVNDKDGLIDNYVNYTYMDRQNNLWCSTVNGISMIELSSPICFYDKYDGLTSKLEDLVIFNKSVLIASTDIYGLEKSGVIDKFIGKNFGQPSFSFTKVKIDNQDKLLIVGYDGIYSMGRDMVHKVEIPNLYAWKIIQSQVDSNRIYIGTETDGVASAYWDGNNFKLETFYPNSGELVRSMVEYKGKVYYGISKSGVAVLDSTRTQEENLIPGIKSDDLKDFYLEVFRGKLFCGTSDGLYCLSEDGKEMEPFDKFNLVEEKLYVHRVLNESDERLWLALFYNAEEDNETPVFGYLEPNGENDWKFVKAPFKHFALDIVQAIGKDHTGNVWIGADDRTYVLDMQQLKNLQTPFNININKFYYTSSQDTSLFENFNMYQSSMPDLVYDNNSVKIEVSAQSYYGGAKNLFRYRLKGVSSQWSEWTDINWREYQNLHEGTYTIEVQAMDYYGNLSKVKSITFTILPPWYRTWWAYVIYVVTTILIIYGLIMLSLQRVKQQKKRLEAIVRERTAEIAKQNEVLAEQKDEIELKNQDILDSIKYAKRIQDSILPPKAQMDEMFTDYFVLFKPKDIVSGDFYWAEKVEGKSLFAAVDCTGHGVPGAMVSVVGNNGLNRSVKEFNLKSPGPILDQLREIVIDAFNAQNNMDVKDGMDMALCAIDYDNLKLEFSGANNPCIIIRNGEILETKADKQPIGQFIHKTPFTNHEIDLQRGDTIYVYSDGYVDQFGGDKGKKLKSKPFKKLLLEIEGLPMKKQKEKLDAMFEQWRGNYEQIDDVCVFGVKI